MAAYNKFNQFLEDVMGGVHDLFGTTPGTDCHACDIYLSNATPDAELDGVAADLAEITQQNGYAGPTAITNNGTRSTTTFTFSGLSIQWTASGGSFGPFQYVALMNDEQTSPADPLISWWDYGSALTINDGESFSVLFNGAAVGVRGNIFTFT